MLRKNLGLIISLLIGLIISLLYWFGIANKLETKLGYDTSFLYRRNTLPSSNIIVIGIDQKSLDYIGNFPWRREYYAKLLTYLGKEPKVVGFDIIMPENSEHIEDDIFLSEVLKVSTNVVLPVSLEPSSFNENELTFVYPLDEFSKYSEGLGNIHFFPDSDGIVRKSKIQQNFKDEKGAINLFSYEIAKIYLDKSHIDLPDEIYCNFQGKEEVFTTYSFFDVISGKVKPEKFRDSIVLIGALAEGLQDRISSPIGPMYGVLYHAQMVSNILQKDYIQHASKETNVLLIFLVSVLSFLFWKYFDALNQFVFITVSLVSLFIGHYYLFSNNIYVSITNIIGANFLTFFSLTLFSQFKTSRALKHELNKLISNYNKRSLKFQVSDNTSHEFDTLNLRNTDKKFSGDSNALKVTELANIGNTLNLERNFLETLLKNIKISILVTESDSNIQLANPAAEDFFEIYNIYNKKLTDISEFIPELKEQVLKVFSGEISLPVDFEIERGTSVYKFKLLELKDETQNKSDSKIVCLIENVTDWHQMANKDGLTNLWNQRYFKDHLNKEIQKAIKFNKPLSLIMMDVDHFKSFNDTYGHQTGDIVLKTISSVIQKNVRSKHIPARYGGEEFGIILTLTDENEAFEFAEQIRKDIESQVIFDINGEPVRKVTSSLGVTIYDGGTVSDFVEKADQALYFGKETGRNRVTKFADIKDKIET